MSCSSLATSDASCCTSTSQPTAAWVWRQLLEATPYGHKPRFLLRDRDRVYGSDFAQRTERLDITTVLSPIRAPKANAIAERVVGTFRRECLDHLIIVNEWHLHRVLQEFTAYYNHERPHRSLNLAPPVPFKAPSDVGEVRSRPILGGLHHAYRRAA